jgi:hypothetical protein
MLVWSVYSIPLSLISSLGLHEFSKNKIILKLRFLIVKKYEKKTSKKVQLFELIYKLAI